MAVYPHHGSWWIDVTVKGKRIVRQGGYKNKLDAQIAEREAKEGVTTSTDWLKLCEARLEDVEIKRSKDHFRTNKKLFQELTKRFGGKIPTRDDIEKYLIEVARQSTKLANRRLVLIRSLFNHGVKRKWFRINPTDGIEKFPVEKKRKYIPPQTDIELILEVATCEERRYILVVAHTLGRPRSVNKLKWEDIYDEYLCLYTRKARNSDLKEIKVPMNAVLRRILDEIPREGEYVFMNKRTNTFYGYRSKLMHTLCREAGVKYFSYYSLRHFGASKLSNRGAPLTDVQQMLGHSLPTTTDHYLQELAGSPVKSAELLEDLE